MNSIGKLIVLTAATSMLGTLPAAAQTFSSAQQSLPAPQVVRMPSSFGGNGSFGMQNQAVPSGEYATQVHGVGDRLAVEQRIKAERYAQAKALIAQRGAGKPIVLRKARY
jgi:hypothetical protein